MMGGREADDVCARLDRAPPLLSLYMVPLFTPGSAVFTLGRSNQPPTTSNTHTYLIMEEAALSSRLNTQEKLLISQAVYKLGAVNWEKISALLENHPVIEGRPKEWFDATTVEAYYVGLMTEIGQNVYVSLPLIPYHERINEWN
jgi:hypothetical protein